MNESTQQWERMRDALYETGIPLPVKMESKAAQAAHELLASRLVTTGAVSPTVDDTAGLLTDLWDSWANHTHRTPDPMLVDAVNAALAEGIDTKPLVNQYFPLLVKLHDRYAMPWSHAIGLLGNISLIELLGGRGNMSAGQISDILNGDIPYNAIQDVLHVTGHATQITWDDVDRLTNIDRGVEQRVFKDDSMEGTFDTMRDIFSRLGDDGVIADSVHTLWRIHFLPYLGVLHYEMLSVGKYDRKPGVALYEFAPRGDVSKQVWERYQRHDNTQNPYLNNFKGVRDVNQAWVENRFTRGGATVEGAAALVRIFEHFALLPYPARRYAASIIRGWLLRLLDTLDSTPIKPIPMPNEQMRVEFLEAVAAGNTGTYGIIDQRVVDFLAEVSHGDNSGVFHGFGSSVNETNLSAAKFGDVEWMDAANARIVAYEAHGGLLSDSYIDAHLATLRRTVARRADDLNAIADADKWQITIMFIDHGNQPLRKHKDGENVDLGNDFRAIMRYMTYQELLDSLGGTSRVAKQESSFNKLVHHMLSGDETRPVIRESYQRMLSRKIAE